MATIKDVGNSNRVMYTEKFPIAWWSEVYSQLYVNWGINCPDKACLITGEFRFCFHLHFNCLKKPWSRVFIYLEERPRWFFVNFSVIALYSATQENFAEKKLGENKSIKVTQFQVLPVLSLEKILCPSLNRIIENKKSCHIRSRESFLALHKSFYYPRDFALFVPLKSIYFYFSTSI